MGPGRAARRWLKPTGRPSILIAPVPSRVARAPLSGRDDFQGPLLGGIINQFVLYGLLALGAVGVAFALPRRGANPQVLGGLIAAVAAGLIILLLSIAGREHLPNVYFYIFSLIGLGASLRVVTHPRPVYAALYFVLTILASAGLYLILAAEFVAFALIIVYAGAILITYLFVIMLATQAPTEEHLEVLNEYDVVSREPIAGTIAGFILLAVLTTMTFGGLRHLPEPTATPGTSDALLVALPGKVERSLREADLIADEEELVAIDSEHRAATVRNLAGVERQVAWPERLQASTVEGVGFSLLYRHPGAIEIAGVILLMAMLGAVVLSRKQVQMEEEAKARQAHRLGSAGTPAAGGGGAS